MGVKDEEGNVCYLIGLLKASRKQLQKGDGDSVHVVIPLDLIAEIADWCRKTGNHA